MLTVVVAERGILLVVEASTPDALLRVLPRPITAYLPFRRMGAKMLGAFFAFSSFRNLCFHHHYMQP